jgi:bifunctional aspartokinase / homoserine dehydrogenase 1
MSTLFPARAIDTGSVRARGKVAVPAVRDRYADADRPVVDPAVGAVLKFGGSSLANPDRIRAVRELVLAADGTGRIVVVVSAFHGVTGQLLDCAGLAARRDASWQTAFDKIAIRHRTAIHDLFCRAERGRIETLVEDHLDELLVSLRGIRLVGHCSPAALDTVASFGERLSALIVAEHLTVVRPARFVDARKFVITDDQFTRAAVLDGKTNAATRAYFSSLWAGSFGAIPVVTGFIGSTTDGRTTTIGRNGSDYTASIIGGALNASAIEIWTDVDGVLSADPREVSSAFVLPQITYDHAMEMSYFGAKVLHPAAIAPAVAASIPIIIKNTLNPTAPGTIIHENVTNGHRTATGITSLSDLTLVTLQRSAAISATGTAERLFKALGSRGVHVVLTCQASSEQTISVALQSHETAAATDALVQEFKTEIQAGAVALDTKSDQALVSLIGEGVTARPEVAWSAFSALGRHNIPISAIAQGVANRNIACIVDAAHQSRAVNVVHGRFFDERKPLALAIVGVGRVGSALLSQLTARQGYLREQGFDVTVVALANSKRFVVDAGGIDLENWQQALDASSQPMDVGDLTRQLAKLNLCHGAVIDCTADAGIVDGYFGFVEANLHIITPNKRANVLPWTQYSALMDLLAARRAHFFYEANVGAGLPVVSTLRDLIASGDRIVKVEGIVSGTLSYLFNTFDGTVPFSALVRDAQSKGLTEPDPREDLSGEDVARKLLILARQTGVRMELQDVDVESLVPVQLKHGPFSPAFFTALEKHDDEIAHRLRRANARGAVLRYVATLEGGTARAGLQEVARDHALAAVKGTDNIIAFTTTRYANTPLVVQGPGAGADVTAMGVFSDLMKLLQYLPR